MERVATRLLGYTLRPSLKRLDEVLAVSLPAKKFADNSFKIQSVVLSNVVNLEWFRSAKKYKADDSHAIRIIFLGRLVERKGALQLLQAVAALPSETLQKIEVIIGGRGPLLPHLESYVAQTKLQDVVTFRGFIEEAEKPAFLHQADIAVFPSTGGESFGIVLLEAMAAGAGVVIGGNNEGYASVLAPFPETLFDPDDSSSFSRKLQTLIENKTTRQRLHNAQEGHVKSFDVAVIGPKLIEHYENAIAKRQRKLDNKHK